jgi:hypothetical protein
MFENLIKHRLVRKGTWLGVAKLGEKVFTRVSMESITTDGHIVGMDCRTNQRVKFSALMVAEIDGMSLNRFLAQADLDSQGRKIENLVRRGRKPKIRD